LAGVLAMGASKKWDRLIVNFNYFEVFIII